MIDFIYELIDAYGKYSGKVADAIHCSPQTTIAFKNNIDPNYIHVGIDGGRTTILGLRLVEVYDMLPGTIIVCRSDDNFNYPKMEKSTNYYLNLYDFSENSL